MQNKLFYELSPLIDEINDEYTEFRKKGNSRENAVARIKELYANEINDEDDSPFISIAIALALCNNSELTKNILSEALISIEKLIRRNDIQKNDQTIMQVREYLSRERKLDEKTLHKTKKKYNPCWEIGDTFAHKLTFPYAKKYGINGWYVIFRKVNEFIDPFDKQRQLVYVTLCPPDKLPTNEKELGRLGYLIMRPHDSMNEYLAQIIIESKTDEKKYEFIKIGSYPKAGHPINQVEVNPMVLTVILGKAKLSDPWAPYEETICYRYKDFGMSQVAT